MQKEIKNNEKGIKNENYSPLGVHIEIDKVSSGMLVRIENVRSITDICREEIIVKTKGGRVKISGSGLEVSVYENRILDILGKVYKVEFI